MEHWNRETTHAEPEGRERWKTRGKKGAQITGGREGFHCKWDGSLTQGCRISFMFQKDLSGRAEIWVDLSGRLLEQKQPPSRRTASGPGERGWRRGLQTGISQPWQS